MGSIPRSSVLYGEQRRVPSAPITELLHLGDRGNRTALIYNDETSQINISYAELETMSNKLARGIVARAQQIGPNHDGDYVIAVCMKPCQNTVISLLSIWKSGGAYVPMEPCFPQARINHILTDARPSLVIYDETANSTMFSSSGVPAVSFDELMLESSNLNTSQLNTGEQLHRMQVNSIAIVLYTSGSTGVPKGVRISYGAICNRLWWQFTTFPFADTEMTCVWKTALTFVDSVSELWGPLLNGRSLLILSKEHTRDPQRLVQALAEHQVQRVVLVPTLLRSILMYLSLDTKERPLIHLKLWVCSGETLSKELAAQFFQYFGGRSGYKLANFYGSTEVMGDVTFCVLENQEQLDYFPTIPIGAPIQNSAVYLLDSSLEIVGEGARGEVWVAGGNLAAGYVGGQGGDKFLDNPHAVRTEFARLYRTGDFGVIEKGQVLFAGRTDSQVKIRGNRVDLQEVERAVNGAKGIEKGVVLCYGLERGNPEILAFVTLTPEVRLSSNQIESALKSSLTSYMIPQVIVIDSIPLLVNGKVDRQALLKMYENTNNNDDSAIPLEIDYTGVEANHMEAAKVLFETVGEVLGRSVRGVLSVRTGFYEVGGNSLNSIFTITKLRDEGYYIQISDFIAAANFGEVLSKLSTSPDFEERSDVTFTADMMEDEHKDRVIEMIVSSFYEKAELEQCVKHEIQECDYADCIEACWSALLAARLSVILKDATGLPVAVALNFDAREEPDIELQGGLAKIMAFLEHVEGPVRDTMLPEGKGTVLHSFMMATASTLSSRDNVAAIRALEHSTMRIARDRGFSGVFTTNTSPLTQQLGTDVLGFKTLLDYQINKYIDSNGERVFATAPDNFRVIVCWKPVE